MPIYEYSCSNAQWDPQEGRFIRCVRFELIRPISESEDNARCPQCGAVCLRIPSTATMRPDTLWAGHVDPNYGYVTSSTKLKQIMRDKRHVTVGDRTDREGMDKVAEEAQKAKEAKLAKDMRKWSEKAFGSSGLGLGGADGDKLIQESQ